MSALAENLFTDSLEAVRLLNWLFEPDDLVCVVDKSNGWAGRVLPLSEIATPDFMAELAARNEAGADIYFSINPFLSGEVPEGRDSARYAANVKAIRCIAIDVDDNADAVMALLAQLTPDGWVQESSKGKFQKFWRVNASKAEFDAIVGALIAAGGDPKVKDLPRLMRLPGFRNCKPKYGPDFPRVTTVQESNHVATIDEFKPLLDRFKPAIDVPVKTALNDFLTWVKVEVGVGLAEELTGETISLGVNGDNCPFHESTHDGYSKNKPFGWFKADAGFPCFRCHQAGCDVGGDIFDFVALDKGLGKGEAIRQVINRKFGNRATAEAMFKLAQASEPAKSPEEPAEAASARGGVESIWDLATKVCDLEVVERAWLVDGLFAEGELTYLSGDFGSFKSFIAMFTAEAIATGKPLFNRATRQHSVIVLDRENSATTWTMRRKLIGDLAEDIPVRLLGRFTKVKAVELVDPRLLEACRRERPFIIIDSFQDFHDGLKEDKADDMTIVGHWLDGLIDAGAVGVLVLHHVPKNQKGRGGKYRGSTAIIGGAGAAMFVEKTGKTDVSITAFKTRDGEDIQLNLKLNFPENVGKITYTVNGETSEQSIRAKVIETIQNHPGESRNGIVKLVGGKRQNVLAVIEDLARVGLATVSKGAVFPAASERADF
jgi:AAA domain/RepB DNA-primase from phage plasmid